MALNHLLRKHYHRWLPYMPAHLVYHGDYFRILRLLEGRAETRQGAIEQQLRHILTLAVRHVPFYRRAVRLTSRALAHEPVHALLARFPYIDKSIVMECRVELLDERLNPLQPYCAYSSGSIGQRICVWRNKRLADIEKASYMHEWGRFGFSFQRSRILRIGADAIAHADNPRARTIGNRLLLSPDHLSPAHKPAILAALNRFKPEYLHGYPGGAAALAELLRPGDLDFSFRAALLASEPILPHQGRVIAQHFACPMSISCGLTERTNLAFADWTDGTSAVYRFEPLYGVSENCRGDGYAEIVGTSL